MKTFVQPLVSPRDQRYWRNKELASPGRNLKSHLEISKVTIHTVGQGTCSWKAVKLKWSRKKQNNSFSDVMFLSFVFVLFFFYNVSFLLSNLAAGFLSRWSGWTSRRWDCARWRRSATAMWSSQETATCATQTQWTGKSSLGPRVRKQRLRKTKTEKTAVSNHFGLIANRRVFYFEAEYCGAFCKHLHYFLPFLKKPRKGNLYTPVTLPCEVRQICF